MQRHLREHKSHCEGGNTLYLVQRGTHQQKNSTLHTVGTLITQYIVKKTLDPIKDQRAVDSGRGGVRQLFIKACSLDVRETLLDSTATLWCWLSKLYFHFAWRVDASKWPVLLNCLCYSLYRNALMVETPSDPSTSFSPPVK